MKASESGRIPTQRQYVSIEEASQSVGMSTKTIRRAIRDGHLTGYRYGKRVLRVDAAELDGLFHVVPSAQGD